MIRELPLYGVFPVGVVTKASVHSTPADVATAQVPLNGTGCYWLNRRLAHQNGEGTSRMAVSTTAQNKAVTAASTRCE